MNRRYHAISGRTPRSYRETALYRDEWIERNVPPWAKPAKTGYLRRGARRVVEVALLATLALARAIRRRE